MSSNQGPPHHTPPGRSDSSVIGELQLRRCLPAVEEAAGVGSSCFADGPSPPFRPPFVLAAMLALISAGLEHPALIWAVFSRSAGADHPNL